MAAITSTGVGSGLDVESLVTKLVAAESTPITLLKKRTDGLQTQLSAYGKVQSALSTLRDAASKLTSVDSWAANKASSTDASAVAVTAGTSTVPGNFSVSVSQLATSQSISSQVLPSTGVGTGTITIELGSWNADQTAFTSKDGASAISIDITEGNDSLTTIRDKINASGAGVVASIVTDASGARLVMRSSNTGESNAFRVSVAPIADANGVTPVSTSLSALAFDPSSGVTAMTQNIAAGNANAKINGLDIVSESNKLEESIDGLSITLMKTTSSDVTLTIDQDSEALKTNITAFVTAYNAMVTLMRDQTKYDESNKTAGTLQGDSTLIGLQGQLRSIVSGSTTLGGAFSRMADIGLSPAADGTLTVNDAKLTAALGNLTDLKGFFKGVDTSDGSNSGFATRLRKYADEALGTDGRISSKQKSLQTSISNNGKREDQLQAHLDLVEKRLRAQYQALDTQMGKLNSLSTYVTQQMSLLNSSSSSS